MPITIYKENTTEIIACLCDDIWDLPNQISELEKWLKEKSKKLPKAKHIIDIGFDIRPDANGGGTVLSSKCMKIMSENNFDLFLSEYPRQLGK